MWSKSLNTRVQMSAWVQRSWRDCRADGRNGNHLICTVPPTVPSGFFCLRGTSAVVLHQQKHCSMSHSAFLSWRCGLEREFRFHCISTLAQNTLSASQQVNWNAHPWCQKVSTMLSGFSHITENNLFSFYVCFPFDFWSSTALLWSYFIIIFIYFFDNMSKNWKCASTYQHNILSHPFHPICYRKKRLENKHVCQERKQ